MPKHRQGAAKKGSTIKTVGVKEVPRQPIRRARLPIIKSGKPGTLDLTNAQIYDLIRFP